MFLCQNKRILYLKIISLVTITVILNDVKQNMLQMKLIVRIRHLRTLFQSVKY